MSDTFTCGGASRRRRSGLGWGGTRGRGMGSFLRERGGSRQETEVPAPSLRGWALPGSRDDSGGWKVKALGLGSQEHMCSGVLQVSSTWRKPSGSEGTGPQGWGWGCSHQGQKQRDTQRKGGGSKTEETEAAQLGDQGGAVRVSSDSATGAGQRGGQWGRRRSRKVRHRG